MYIRKFSRKGFTLVELIIVIAIIAILSVSAFMVLTKWIGESRDSRRLSDVSTIQRALSTYKADHNANPNSTLDTSSLEASYVENNSGHVGTGIYNGDFNQDFIDEQSKFDVLQKVVADPDGSNKYKISIDAVNNKKFSVAATLENGDGDPQAAVRGNYSHNSNFNIYSGDTSTTTTFTGGITSLVPHNSSVLDGTTTGKAFTTGHFVEEGKTKLPYSLSNQ